MRGPWKRSLAYVLGCLVCSGGLLSAQEQDLAQAYERVLTEYLRASMSAKDKGFSLLNAGPAIIKIYTFYHSHLGSSFADDIRFLLLAADYANNILEPEKWDDFVRRYPTGQIEVSTKKVFEEVTGSYAQMLWVGELVRR